MVAKQKKIVLWEDMSLVAMNGLYKNHVLAKKKIVLQGSHVV